MRAEVRHQLKEDRFRGTTLQVAGEAAHWTVEHKAKLITAGLAVLIIAAAIAGGWYYLNSQDEKASVELSRALRTMDAQIRPADAPAQPDVPSFTSAKERATEASKQFQTIVDKYAHTRSADVARYFLGINQADAGDYGAAQRELSAVAGYHNADLSSLGKLALASVYRQQRQNKKAMEIYRALADKPTAMVSKATAQLELAATLLDDQQPLEARSMYERVQKENPATPAAQFAGQAIQDMK